MPDITLSREVLKLNKLHQPIGLFTPKKVFIALANWQMDRRQETFLLDSQGRRMRKMLAYDIAYAQNQDGSYDFSDLTDMRLVDWDEWITLPVRNYDLVVHTPKLVVRVPRVVMSLLSDDMPITRHSNNLNTVYELYEGVCQYSKRKIPKSRASRDHYIPRKKGGKNDLSNIVLCDKDINSRKGDRYNHECGLPEVVPIVPKELPIMAVLRNDKGVPEWDYMLRKYR
jgi:hypothetical protein